MKEFATISNEEFPTIGVGVLVLRRGKILLGKRKGAHGAGCWSAPGGHLERGETLEVCAKRELAEEVGLSAEEFIFGPYTEDYFEENNRHYLTTFLLVQKFKGIERTLEPNKCEGWLWFPVERLPMPLFGPLNSLQMQGYFNSSCFRRFC